MLIPTPFVLTAFSSVSVGSVCLTCHPQCPPFHLFLHQMLPCPHPLRSHPSPPREEDLAGRTDLSDPGSIDPAVNGMLQERRYPKKGRQYDIINSRSRFCFQNDPALEPVSVDPNHGALPVAKAGHLSRTGRLPLGMQVVLQTPQPQSLNCVFALPVPLGMSPPRCCLCVVLVKV